MKFINYISLCILFVLTILSGCSLVKIDKEIKEIASEVHITGKINHAKHPDTPIVIGLFSLLKNKQYKLEQSTVVYGNSTFEFLIPEGNYYLGAFADTNQDFTLQANESAGWYGKPSLLKAKSGKKFHPFKIQLKPPAQVSIDFPAIYHSSNKQIVALDNDKKLGRKLNLSSPLISHSVGKLGLWHPLKFVREHKHGIFLLQDYDPNKIPVLFFHGIGGSGADLKTLISSIDNKRFQPWVVQYPSGLRLELVSSHISSEINKLRSKYHFDKYIVIAHSMGGLVSRSIIERQLQQKRKVEIPLFVSISTPWDGHKAALWGVEGAPVPIPVWFDIVPGSPFLKTLHQQMSQTSVKHHLLFSYKGSLSLINKENNDGTVTLSSELLPIAQKHAEEVYGFNVDHVDILKSKALLDKVNGLLSKISF